MKRFHVHVSVSDISESIEFYSNLFGVPPTKTREDYAKWMLEDPRVNFAISARGHAPGINHLGFQAETAEELAGLKTLAEASSKGKVFDQGEAACCYAKSEKHWMLDPQGIAWEHFQTMEEAEEYGKDTREKAEACCIPIKTSTKEKASCCVPQRESAASSCCG